MERGAPEIVYRLRMGLKEMWRYGIIRFFCSRMKYIFTPEYNQAFLSRSRRVNWFAVSLLAWFFAFVWWRTSTVPAELLELYSSLHQTAHNSSSCQLPHLDPWDPSILKHVSKPPGPIECKPLQPNFSSLSWDGYLTLNTKEIEKAGYKIGESLACRFREYEHNSGVDDDSVKITREWKEILDREKVRGDFVEVECRKNLLNVQVYSYHWSQISPKAGDENLVYKDAPSGPFKKTGPGKEGAKPKLSVLMLGIDSMSRSNFIRQLPKTFDFITKHMGGNVFDGFVKVGDNTYVNMIAFLTGKRVWDLPEFHADIKDELYMFYDDWTEYIWQKFSREHYATLFAEDRPDISNFNYKGYLYGFKHKPMTHYYRPFWFSTFWSSLHRRSSAFCYDRVPEHIVQLNWLEQFVRKYGEKRTRAFSLYWLNSLGHEVLNLIGVADDDFKQFFVNSHAALNESIVIVISDHGHRYASIRESVIGRLEARMPFFALIVPQWLKKQYPNLERNLRINSGRLTTQFDVHSTLLDIVEGNYDYETIETEKRREKTRGRSFSLFGPVPKDRQCHEANVPEEYCPCYQEVKLSHDSPTALKASEALMDHINGLLRATGGKCLPLRLSKVEDASSFLPHKGTLRDPQTGKRIPQQGFHVNHRVSVYAEPSGALFEAVIQHSLDTGLYSVAGDIERNNKYGNTSHCMTDRLLLKLCYCV